MSDLIFIPQALSKIQGTSLIKLTGGIDSMTIGSFTKKLNILREQKYNKFILDLEHVPD